MSDHDRAYARFCETGDPAALAEVYDATADRLLRTAVHLAPSVAAAEDLLQATFLAAIEKAAEFERGRPVLPWLLGILANQSRLARWRDGRTPDPDRLERAPGPEPHELAVHQEERRALDAAIDALPSTYRPVLVLHVRHHMSAAEIALALGRPAGTVRSQLSRGLEFVRRGLPPGLAGALAILLAAPRGLAAVRGVVLAAASPAAAGVTASSVSVLGAVMMKKLVVVVCVAVALSVVYLAWPDSRVPQLPGEAPESEVRRVMQPEEPAAAPSRQALAGPAASSAAAPEGDPAGAAAPTVGARRGELEVVLQFQGSRKPAAGVHVLVTRAWEPWGEWQSARTGADGKAKFSDLAPGYALVQCVRGGSVSVDIRAGSKTTQVLAIPGGVAVAVRVVDASARPLPGVAVWLSEPWRVGRGVIAGHTGTDGDLLLEHVSPDCHVAARGDGFAPSPSYRVRGPRGGSCEIRIALQRGSGTVSGRVLDVRGEPVPGARVLVGSERPALSSRAQDGSWTFAAPPTSCATGSDGTFTVRGVPLGVLPVQVRHSSFAPWRGEVECTPESVAQRDVVLEDGAELAGTATDPDGRPVRFARITVGDPNAFAGRSVTCRSDGTFELRGLSSGEQAVRAEFGRRHTAARLQFPTAGKVVWNPVIEEATAPPAGERWLDARVVDLAGQPLAGWRVVAQQVGGTGVSRSLNADGEGRVRFAVPWQEVRIWVHRPRGWSGFPALLLDRVEVGEGEILLRVEPAVYRAAVVHGRVTDESGKPIAAQLQMWHEERQLWRAFDTDGSTGAFRIEDVPPGRVQIKVCPQRRPWRKLPTHQLQVGQELDLGRIEIAAGAVLTGRVRYAGGEPPAQLALQLLDRTGNEAAVVHYADGVYRSGAVHDGTYRLHVSGDRVRWMFRDVRVSGGQADIVDLEVGRAALRVVEVDWPAGVERPRFLQLHAYAGAAPAPVWTGGIGNAGPLRFRVSVPPGSYRLVLYGPGRKKWAAAPLQINGLSDVPQPMQLQVAR